MDDTKATEDAKRLYEAGEKQWGTDEATFNMVIASRSFPQLRATFDAYFQVSDCTKSQSVKSNSAFERQVCGNFHCSSF